MTSRLTKDGVVLSQNSNLTTVSASTSVPLNLDEGQYWNFNSAFTTSSNAGSTPTVEDLRANANWNTGLSSNLVVTFTYLNSTTNTLRIGGLEILSETGSDGKSTIKDVKLEVSSDTVTWYTVLDDVSLPEDSDDKQAYILLPTEDINAIGHPHKVSGSGYGYNHYRLTIKNGHSVDNIKISSILIRPSSLKFTVTDPSNKPAVFSKKTNIISTGEISSSDINMGTTGTSLDTKFLQVESDIASNTLAISNISTSLSMSDFTTNLFLDTSLYNVHATGVLWTWGPPGSGATHEVPAFSGFKTNSTYTSQHKLAFYNPFNGYSELIISDLIAIDPSNAIFTDRLYLGYDDQEQMDDGQYVYFDGNDLWLANHSPSVGGYSNTVGKFYRIDIIK